MKTFPWEHLARPACRQPWTRSPPWSSTPDRKESWGWNKFSFLCWWRNWCDVMIIESVDDKEVDDDLLPELTVVLDGPGVELQMRMLLKKYFLVWILLLSDYGKPGAWRFQRFKIFHQRFFCFLKFSTTSSSSSPSFSLSSPDDNPQDFLHISGWSLLSTLSNGGAGKIMIIHILSFIIFLIIFWPPHCRHNHKILSWWSRWSW